ncbi:putative mannose-phosphate isomerase [Corynebacterium kutscheri]|uniref:mannose-6-phosphate isomerase n=1 Tax=Corynebacterium kutscheri TaxID=35755 RepID=A0A0F6QYP2_9CORY|nr:mannose-6-phosphate isomerase, type 1 [Corynebacterium kutscheri]VEH11099.1 putative mannose-phosphate isomerase [Corynebacterium kutscheri]VEH80423.1 putative mannose-phosphate isomerase [Corynebacterium kutscheri]
MITPLVPRMQNYPWGSRTLIAQLQGREESAKPEAELWYGAHPAGSSTIGDSQQSLLELINECPQEQLGEDVIARFGQRLPFLLKILAAGEPLSLQAHPTLVQAQEGFARENELGIDIAASNRNYRDDNHKPELLVALTEFHAMAGFRPLERTKELFHAIACPELDRYVGMLDDADSAQGLRALFTTWITIPSGVRHQLIDAIISCVETAIEKNIGTWVEPVLRNLVVLNNRYPGDIGVLGALLLNYIILQPGEAIYLDAGNLHAYVSGLAVEIMANSDNVLRGGLTSKYVDVPELVKVLRFETLADPLAKRNGHEYEVPIDEFVLSCFDVDGELTLDSDKPSIILCTSGQILIGEYECGPSQAVWVSADHGDVVLSGTGTVFVASIS